MVTDYMVKKPDGELILYWSADTADSYNEFLTECRRLLQEGYVCSEDIVEIVDANSAITSYLLGDLLIWFDA